MVLVEKGAFLMGSDDALAEDDEKPLREVFLKAFYIDQFEVTNFQYKEFNPDHRYPSNHENFPINRNSPFRSPNPTVNPWVSVYQQEQNGKKQHVGLRATFTLGEIS